MTETLSQRIARHEGFCAFAKVDVPPMLCIGYGHDITQSAADTDYANGITRGTALSLLQDDIARAKRQLTTELPWTVNLSQIRQEVLIEMVFQLGINGLLKFKNMLACAKRGDDKGVYDNMLSSKWHDQTPARCAELANLWINNLTT